MILVLVVVAGSTAFVTRGRAAHRVGESIARLEEALDAGFGLLVEEVRLAGYLGLAAPQSPVTGATTLGTPERTDLVVAGGCGASLAHDLAIPVAAVDASYAASPGVALGCRPSPDGRAMVGADTLVLRHAAAEPASAQAGRLQLDTNLRSALLSADGVATLGAGARRHDLEVGSLLRQPRCDRSARLALAAAQATRRRDAPSFPGRGVGRLAFPTCRSCWDWTIRRMRTMPSTDGFDRASR